MSWLVLSFLDLLCFTLACLVFTGALSGCHGETECSENDLEFENETADILGQDVVDLIEDNSYDSVADISCTEFCRMSAFDNQYSNTDEVFETSDCTFTLDENLDAEENLTEVIGSVSCSGYGDSLCK